MSTNNREVTTLEETARMPSTCLSLSPLCSPVDANSHVDSLGEMLLAGMEPEDKWKVAVAQAPKISKKTPTSSSGASTSRAPSTTPSLPGRCTKRPAAGEEASTIDAMVEIEVSRGVRDGGKGWGKPHSYQAVEELHQWLLQSDDFSDAPPPPYDRERSAQALSSSLKTLGVQVDSGLQGGRCRVMYVSKWNVNNGSRDFHF